ncbi:hypothetical protein [Paenibacillus daejeonensis]|uniref:hypothetical protein n=1 Tax=Paenibacillus daejeonensis TaxID=135193 RepID=UPI00036FDD65|nr:hypothetical protein [Paenibacillus daejeonensis]
MDDQLTRLNQQLQTAAERRRHKQKWERQIQEYTKQLHQQERLERQLEHELKTEKADVDKLNSLSIANLFYTIMGSKQERMDKEQQDIVRVKLQYDQAMAELAQLKEELTELRSLLSDVYTAEREYEQLFAAKKALIREHYSEFRDALDAITDEENELNVQLKELNEALTAGNHLRTYLEQAGESLSKAKQWGTWDMVGGGTLSTYVKRGHMDDAREFIHHAQHLVARFQQELADVRSFPAIEIDLGGGFMTFADYFFDGLIVDWMVQGRIKESQDRVSNALHSLRPILRKLQEETARISGRLTAAKQERIRLVEQAKPS